VTKNKWKKNSFCWIKTDLHDNNIWWEDRELINFLFDRICVLWWFSKMEKKDIYFHIWIKTNNNIRKTFFRYDLQCRGILCLMVPKDQLNSWPILCLAPPKHIFINNLFFY
jgi:hypothetical protein